MANERVRHHPLWTPCRSKRWWLIIKRREDVGKLLLNLHVNCEEHFEWNVAGGD